MNIFIGVDSDFQQKINYEIDEIMREERLEQMTNQEKEIKTIKPRTYKLKLSDADVERLRETASYKGLTPEQLLEIFIGDLVDGTYSSGSDERLFASEYFDRLVYFGGDE